MSVHTLQVNMTKGELTPYLHSRVDTEFYQGGLRRLRNACVLRYGGVTRVPGTIFMGEAKEDDRKARWLRFEFNREQVYAIETGHQYFRFWTREGRIESPPGTPVEVATSYQEDDLKFLQARQSGDVLYLWCRKADGTSYPVKTLTRNSETSWTLANYEPLDGPYLPENTTSTVLTFHDRGSSVPVMSANTVPSGQVANADGDADAWQAFDTNDGSDVNSAGGAGFIEYIFGGGISKTANAYQVAVPSGISGAAAPANWFFEGYDGASWITLDRRENEVGWTGGERRFYEFPNKAPFFAYRLRWIAIQDNAAGNCLIQEIVINQDGDEQTPFSLTASSTTGINDNTGFQTSDVGRAIRLMGQDGRWRWAKIASRVSSTSVTIRLYGHAMPYAGRTLRWALGAFSTETGWPTAGAVFEDRLFHARTEEDPLGVWGSVSADYDNFRVSSPVVDDDGLSVRLTGGKLNDIGWLNENRDLVAGTAGSLRAIGRNDPGKALSPSNIRQRTETIAPSSIAEPITIENVILFLDFFEQRLYEAAFTYEVEGYLARETSTLNEHLFAAGVAEIAYLSVPHKIIVGRRFDGKLVFFTYDREQKVTGGSLIDVGGEVEAILDLPGSTGTDLWLVVKREIDGADIRYIELLAEFWRADFTVQELPIYAASALVYDDVPTDGLSGLDHLVGETVGVWADGRDLGDVEVDSSGEIELPGGLEASQIVVGLRMTWEVQTLRLAQIGNQDGSGLGRAVNIGACYVDFYEAAGVDVGSIQLTGPFLFEDASEENPDDPEPLRTGMFRTPVDDSWKNTGILYLGGDRMYPATVTGISLQIEGAP